MPWHVRKSDKCPASRPWGVVEEGGEVRGCHASRKSALKQAALLYLKQKRGEIASFDPRDFCPELWPELVDVLKEIDAEGSLDAQ